MSESRTAQSEDETLDGYAWVETCAVAEFVERMQIVREVRQPAIAIRMLHAFAVKRPIAELTESARYFARSDAVHMLATAALCRSAEHAAELATEHWKAARSGTRDHSDVTVTNGIIHDVACQRTALDVAAFVRECRRLGEQTGELGLVHETLAVFAGPSSGRTNLDKALLFVALRDEECGEQADELLRLTLEAMQNHVPAHAADTDPPEFHDLSGALHQLSPSERILEKWVDGQLDIPERTADVRRQVARLIANRIIGRDTLVEHVGVRFSRTDLIEVCRQLVVRDPRDCEAIREHAASRVAGRELAEIIVKWHQYTELNGTTRALLDDIVARGVDRDKGPRPLAELKDLDTALRNEDADPRCRKLLWIAAAEHVQGRSGAEQAALLDMVDRSRDRDRAAQTIARRLSARVRAGDVAPEAFVEYIKGLRSSGRAEAVHLALKELADPAAADRAPARAGAVIAETAALLYAEEAETNGWDLLERCLENEQRSSPEDVVVVVARLRESAMAEEDRLFLLRATIGRWSDTRRREEAVGRLRGAGFDDEAVQVIRSLR